MDSQQWNEPYSGTELRQTTQLRVVQAERANRAVNRPTRLAMVADALVRTVREA